MPQQAFVERFVKEGKSLLIVDNSIDHTSYAPVGHWCSILPGLHIDTVHVPSAGRFPPPEIHSHVILTGSEASITMREAWAEKEAEWVVKAAAKGVAIFGSCWGHQLIAYSMIGAHAVRKASQPEFGWLPVSVIMENPLLPPGKLDMFMFHFDEVIAGSHPDLRIFVTSAHCSVQGFQFGDRPIFGLQAHPEITPEIGRALLMSATLHRPENNTLYHQALQGPVRDSGITAAMLEHFLTL